MSDELFAQRVRARRKEMKRSLREIAQITGIAASTISRIESGKLSPTLAIAEKLAAALGLSQLSAVEAKGVQADTDPITGVPSHIPTQASDIVAYRTLRHMLIRQGIRRDLSRVAARMGYEMAILLSGAVQLRANNGFKRILKPGATIICRQIADRTYFATATQNAELLWIGPPRSH